MVTDANDDIVYRKLVFFFAPIHLMTVLSCSSINRIASNLVFHFRSGIVNRSFIVTGRNTLIWLRDLCFLITPPTCLVLSLVRDFSSFRSDDEPAACEPIDAAILTPTRRGLSASIFSHRSAELSKQHDACVTRS